MTRWNNARTLGGIALALAAASAWLAGRSPADTPPKPSADRVDELEKRLQRIEERLDRSTLKPLDDRTPRFLARPEDIPRLLRARDDVQQTLAKEEATYTEFKKQSPLGHLNVGNGQNVYSERLALIEKRRAELELRQVELISRLNAYERAVKEGTPLAALGALALAGVDVKAARQASPKASDKELAQVLSETLRANIADNIAMMQDLDVKFTKTQKQAQELNNYEAKGDQFRAVIAGLKAEFDSLTERLTAAGWSPDKK